MHQTGRLAALVAALTLLPATAALAHPAFDPNAIPVGQPVETTLVLPHGCSTDDEVMPDQGRAVPTTRVDLQRVDGVTIEPREVQGWDARDDGEAVVWTDAGGATTDPIELPVTLTVRDGTPGDQLALAVYQECEDGQAYRWTEGSESTPPVVLELTEGQPGATAADGEATDAGSEPRDVDQTATAGADDPEAVTDEPTDDTATDDQDLAADEADDDGAAIAAIVAALIVISGGGIVVARRRRTAA